VKFIGVVVILILIFSEMASAEQVQFNKSDVDNYVQFNYRWIDQAQQKQSLSFAIDKTMIFDRFRNFRNYDAIYAKKYVDKKIRQSLIKSPIPGVTVNFLGYGDNLQIELKGKNQADIDKAYATIAQLEKDFMLEQLDKSYYTQFMSFNNQLAIKPDHVRFALASIADFSALKEIILDKFPEQNIREVTNYVLGFVQSIPYSTLESRTTSTGAGFNPPLQTLWQNQGDCDSKVTLIAAIYRALMPRIKMMLVFIDNHALLAMEIEPKADEITITVDNVNYILLEPTGPALMKMGEISADSEFAIRNGRYYAEPFQ
jgi:hypothetical protein|tara:strand:- start:1068 stop:2012 length:945 start_codon:yes stop_codon:yes gene_type:complete